MKAVIEFMRKHKLTLMIGHSFRKLQTICLTLKCDFQMYCRYLGIIDPDLIKIRELKNKFQGDRCFIIATGPSLTNEDILKLKNEYTFSMNAMCLKYDELGWKPTFYGIQDAAVFDKLKEHIKNMGVKYVFVDKEYKRYLGNKDEIYYFSRNSTYNSYDAYIKHRYWAKFSSDPSVIIYDGFSISCTLLQIAVYLGFKEIYLLGCDCNYNQANKYFVNHGHIDPTYSEAGNRMMAGYKAAKKYADKKGIKIFNATRGGMLEVFERVDLDTII